MDAVTAAFYGLTLLLVAGHIGILFGAELPRFLVYENIVLAALYSVGLAAAWRGQAWGYTLVAVVALFSAGRVSRSIVGSRGEVGELAVQHVPLLLLDLAVGLLALALRLRLC